MSARDPRRDPAPGDVIADGNTRHEVLRAEPDEKGRNRVVFVSRYDYHGEQRADAHDYALGAWRHRFGAL